MTQIPRQRNNIRYLGHLRRLNPRRPNHRRLAPQRYQLNPPKRPVNPRHKRIVHIKHPTHHQKLPRQNHHQQNQRYPKKSKTVTPQIMIRYQIRQKKHKHTQRYPLQLLLGKIGPRARYHIRRMNTDQSHDHQPQHRQYHHQPQTTQASVPYLIEHTFTKNKQLLKPPQPPAATIGSTHHSIIFLPKLK